MPELAIVLQNRILSEWPLEDSEITIGRGSDCHISLQDPLMSWHHAKITKAYGGYLIEDLGSTNGIAVNGHKVTKQMLKYGDVIGLGSHELRFNRSIADKYSVPTEKTIGVASLGMGGSSYQQKKSNGSAHVRLLTGPDAGISKPIDTSYYRIGGYGKDTAAIVNKAGIYYLQHISGERITINGNSLSTSEAALKNSDKI